MRSDFLPTNFQTSPIYHIKNFYFFSLHKTSREKHKIKTKRMEMVINNVEPSLT